MTTKDCDLKLIYVTPEKLAKSKMFMNKLQKAYEMGTFTHIAIGRLELTQLKELSETQINVTFSVKDEVHCCSQWGHDFRPDYKYLGVLKQLFPKVHIETCFDIALYFYRKDVHFNGWVQILPLSDQQPFFLTFKLQD